MQLGRTAPREVAGELVLICRHERLTFVLSTVAGRLGCCNALAGTISDKDAELIDWRSWFEERINACDNESGAATARTILRQESHAYMQRLPEYW